MTYEERVDDPVLGLINLYREYKPLTDEIEYTTTFFKDGRKCRHDVRIKSSDIQGVDSDIVASYVKSMIRHEIKQGNYKVWTGDKYEKMHESEPLKGLTEPVEETEGLLLNTSPSETELVIVAMLMRLYDVQMALLSNVNKDAADRLWDAHNEGAHFNPQIFVPGGDDGGD